MRGGLTADWCRASPFSFQFPWTSSSEISVSNLAVSISVTSTLYSGRTTLMSRSAGVKDQSREYQCLFGRTSSTAVYSHTRDIHPSFSMMYLWRVTFNVEVGRGFVRATVAGVFPNVGLLCLPHDQHTLPTVRADGDVLGGSDLLSVLEPLDICDGLAQFTHQPHLVFLHSSVVLQLGGEIQVALCRDTRRFQEKIRISVW